jgi:hypothetical protein
LTDRKSGVWDSYRIGEINANEKKHNQVWIIDAKRVF